ncbi:Caffeoylshikimate esterase [Spatholobus suberectus]|nr:Caffeoylshikimate esterase [Spatholobus suberectus]
MQIWACEGVEVMTRGVVGDVLVIDRRCGSGAWWLCCLHINLLGLDRYLGDMDKIAAISLSFFLDIRHSNPYNNIPSFPLNEFMRGLATLF